MFAVLMFGLVSPGVAAPTHHGVQGASRSQSLTVEVDEGAAAVVVLVQYTFDGTSFSEIGVYDDAEVRGHRATFSLPSSPSADALTNGGGSTVLLAVVLEDENGSILGVSDDVLGWYTTAPTGSRRTGWQIGRALFLSSASSYEAVSEDLEVEANLEGDTDLTASGSTTLSNSSARVVAATSAEDGEAPGDAGGTGRWELEVEDAPDSSTLSTGKHFDYAFYPLEVYADANGDRTWNRSSETDLGNVCSGATAASLRWIAPPTDLTAAAALWHRGLTWGWSVGVVSGASFTEVATSGLVVKSGC